MIKPDFCPFDGKEIDQKNLAYEIVPARGWDWERIQTDTILGTDTKQYMDEWDGKRDRYFNRQISGKRVMLLASREKNGRNGLALLKDFLDRGGRGTSGFGGRTSYEESMRQMYSAHLSLPFFMNQAGQVEEGEQFASNGPVKLHYDLYKGIETFFDENEDPVFYALPCCPYCHNRLPAGWEQADDFIGISLLGPAGSGKTALRYSLLHEDCRQWSRIRMPNGEICTVEPAYYGEELADPEFQKLQEAADRMCRKNGDCPKAEENAWNRLPLFFRLRYGEPDKGKTLLLGLYDFASSEQDGGREGNPADTGRLTDKLYADLYLLDPGTIRSLHLRKKRIAGRVKLTACRMMTPEEQARYQRQNPDVSISARELLLGDRHWGWTSSAVAAKEETGESLADTFARRIRFYRSRQDERHVKKMHFIGAIVKNDLLLGNSEIAEVYPDLLKTDAKEGYETLQDVVERSERAEELLRKYDFLDKGLLEEARGVYGVGMSWHCISALGSEAFEKDHLLGDYQPVHAADPILMCIRNRIAENKWR